MKSYRSSIYIFVCVICFLTIGIGIVHAQLSTEIILKYPDFKDASSPGDLVNKIYLYALSVAGSLAVIRIVYGGVMVVFNQGAPSKLQDAKKIIQEAVIGLLLLAGAFLILQTINPSLTNLGLRGVGSIPASEGPSETASSTGLTHNDMKLILDRYGVAISSSGGCSDRKNKNCTSLDGFPAGGICKLIYIKEKCDKTMGGSCNVVITAGTEVGHKSHGPGKSIVDFRVGDLKTGFDEFILKGINAKKDALGYSITVNKKYENKLIGGTYMWEVPKKLNPPQEGAPHWHADIGIKAITPPEKSLLDDPSTAGEYWAKWNICKND